MEQVKMIINEGKLADESKAGFCAIRCDDVPTNIHHQSSTMNHDTLCIMRHLIEYSLAAMRVL